MAYQINPSKKITEGINKFRKKRGLSKAKASETLIKDALIKRGIIKQSKDDKELGIGE